MKFVMIIGPQAVGKMTVGYELANITGLKLFHNHLTIDAMHPIFDYGTAEGKRIVKLFRKEIFESVARSDMAWPIFTYICDFNVASSRDYLAETTKLFADHGADVCLVELEAELDERLERNKSEFRLSEKPLKRDVAHSESMLLRSLKTHRLNSREGEVDVPNYLRIDNTNLAPDVVAQQIKENFAL